MEITDRMVEKFLVKYNETYPNLDIPLHLVFRWSMKGRSSLILQNLFYVKIAKKS